MSSSRESVPFYSLEFFQLYMSSYQGDQFLFIDLRGRIQLYVNPARGPVPFYSSEMGESSYTVCSTIKGIISFLQFREGRIQLYVHLSSQQGDHFLFIVPSYMYVYPAFKGISSFLQFREGGSSYMSSQQGDQFLFKAQRRKDISICPDIKGMSSFLQFKEGRIQLIIQISRGAVRLHQYRGG